MRFRFSLSFRWAATGMVVLLASAWGFTACGNSGSGTSSPAPVLRTQTGTVVLPAGVHVSLGSLTVVSGADSKPVSSSGTFSLTVYDYGAELVMVEDAAGNLMLMGLLDATHTTIDASTTAQTFIYFDAGLPLLPPATITAGLSALPTASGVAPLASAIGAALATNPDVFASRGTNAALAAAMPSLSELMTEGLLINGNPNPEQSGILVLQDPPYSAHLDNYYRRRAWAFVHERAK